MNVGYGDDDDDKDDGDDDDEKDGMTLMKVM